MEGPQRSEEKLLPNRGGLQKLPVVRLIDRPHLRKDIQGDQNVQKFALRVCFQCSNSDYNSHLQLTNPIRLEGEVEAVSTVSLASFPGFPILESHASFPGSSVRESLGTRLLFHQWLCSVTILFCYMYCLSICVCHCILYMVSGFVLAIPLFSCSPVDFHK